MHGIRLISACAAVLIVGAAAAQKRAPQPAPAVPYKTVSIALPKPMADETFDAMRKQLGEAAQRKDRAAMARLVVAQGFFWQRENRNAADKRKSGFDNLSAALGLTNKGAPAGKFCPAMPRIRPPRPRPCTAASVCAPAEPAYDRKEFADLLKATNSDVTQWGYPVSAGIDVHALPQANAPVIEKLGLHFVRIMPKSASDPASYTRIATPGGNTGYVSINSIAPIGNDQICYVKDGGDWKIGGYIGGGEPQ